MRISDWSSDVCSSDLTPGKPVDVEVADEVVEHPVPVDLGIQVHEHRAEADGGAIHQHELARRRDPAEAAQFLVHLAGDLGAVEAAVVAQDRKSTRLNSSP